MQATIRLAIPLLTLIVVVAGAVAVILPASHAAHEDEGNSLYYWDRFTTSHQRLLNCQSPPNDDRCKIPFMVRNEITDIRLPWSDIISELSNAVTTVNKPTPYIGVEMISRSMNYIDSGALRDSYNAEYDIEQHCTYKRLNIVGVKMHT